jgi:hypothetical protein
VRSRIIQAVPGKRGDRDQRTMRKSLCWSAQTELSRMLHPRG